uniref:Uncharacterized protein n=1 Tax=Arundo donax TaxID=35708 RepID=A0A0A9FBN8_ARUDO
MAREDSLFQTGDLRESNNFGCCSADHFGVHCNSVVA